MCIRDRSTTTAKADSVSQVVTFATTTAPGAQFAATLSNGSPSSTPFILAAIGLCCWIVAMLLYFINAYFIQPEQTQREEDVKVEWLLAHPGQPLPAVPWETDKEWRRCVLAVSIMNFLVLVFSVPVVVLAGLTPSKQSNASGGSTSP